MRRQNENEIGTNGGTKMKKVTYDRNTLIEVLKSYQRMIERSGKEYPRMTLNDIRVSIDYVLSKCAEEDNAK